MRIKAITFALLLLTMTAASSSANLIGIFGDVDGTVCTADMNLQYTTVTVYFLALLTDVPAITAAEFGATGVDLGPTTIPTVTWSTPLVIGNIMTPDGVALAFSPPLTGPVVLLGQISYFLLAPQLPDWVMQVVPSGADVLAVVDGDFNTVAVDGWGLVVNCQVGGPWGACTCLDSIPTEESSWSDVKSLY